MASLVRGEDRIVVLATDLDGSDLPLRIAFPVMMTNAVNWFLARTGELQPSLRTGELAEVTCQRPANEPWAWIDSSGHAAPATVADNIALVGPIGRVGLAQLGPRREATESDDSVIAGSQQLAVNLCDAAESDLKPRLEIVADDTSRTRSGQRSLWFYLAFLGLGLVVGEWFLYQRRIVG
jgi:hypothetical protein